MASRSLKELAEEAYQVQNACNLSGVVHSFSRALSELWEHARTLGEGTDWVNTHPVSVLFADKIAHLTRTQDDTRMHVRGDAYAAIAQLRE